MTSETTRNLVAPRDLLERALSSPKGIRVWFPSEKEAISMRNRMSTLKTSERKKSTKVYPLDSPLYNASPYESLAVVIKAGLYSLPEELKKFSLPESLDVLLRGVWLYILPEGTSDTGFVIEEL